MEEKMKEEVLQKQGICEYLNPSLTDQEGKRSKRKITSLVQRSRFISI
jgi:hypothetical protein